MNHISTESDVDINSTIVDDDKSNVVKQVSKEVIRYDEDYHLYKSNNRPQSVVELYHKLKERVIGITEGIDLRIAKQTIGFRQNKIFTDIIIYNKGLGIVLNLKKGELRDDLQKTEDLSNKGHWGNGEYRIWINSEEELDYALSLIKQAFKKQA